jgi:hypothetical protein
MASSSIFTQTITDLMATFRQGNGPGVFSHELAEMPEGLRVAKEPIFVVVGQLEHARTRRRR